MTPADREALAVELAQAYQRAKAERYWDPWQAVADVVVERLAAEKAEARWNEEVDVDGDLVQPDGRMMVHARDWKRMHDMNDALRAERDKAIGERDQALSVAEGELRRSDRMLTLSETLTKERDALANELAKVREARDRLAEFVNWAGGELINDRPASIIADACFAQPDRLEWQTRIGTEDEALRTPSALDAGPTSPNVTGTTGSAPIPMASGSGSPANPLRTPSATRTMSAGPDDIELDSPSKRAVKPAPEAEGSS